MKRTKRTIQSENIEEKKFRAELWLGITNLILTAIVGIGIAIFLNYRDEKVQEKIVALQAETARQAATAKIQVSTGCTVYNLCHQMLEVVNLGPAPAKNLKVVVVIQDIKDGWTTAVDDINKFSIKKFPPSLEIKSETTRVDILFDNGTIKGDNAFVLTIDNLPAGGKAQAILGLSPDLPVEKAAATRDVTIYYTNWEAQLYFLDELGNYFEDLYTVARFSVSANCDNCIVAEQDDSMMQVSSAGGLSTRGASSQESTQNSWAVSLTIEYEVPQGLQVDPITYPLYFEIIGPNENQHVEFKELAKPK